jgi:transposase
MSEEVAMTRNEAQDPERTYDPRRAEMRTPDDVTAMRRLKALGWGAKRIAAELGCSKTTVKDWLRRGEWRPCAKPSCSKQLDGLADWLAARFRQHAGNADVVRQDLAAEKGIHVSLRTVERAVAPLRQDLVAAARATVQFETPPGEQMQIDFGERRVTIGEEPIRVFLFVATLGYSRRLHVRAFGHERQEDWFTGLEIAFRTFGGVPREVLLDNARTLVLHHDPVSREVVFHPRLQAFAKHWGFGSGPARRTVPAPRARTSAGSATSRGTPWPDAPLPALPAWKRISTPGLWHVAPRHTVANHVSQTVEHLPQTMLALGGGLG